MKYKLIFIILTIPLFVVDANQAQMQLPMPPEWKVTLHAVNEVGMPVPDARAEIESIKSGRFGETERSGGKTDDHGLFTTTGHSWNRLYMHISKPGFYSATRLYDLDMNSKLRHEPWDPTIDLTLKRVIDPIPMIAKTLNLGMPVFEQSVGFDLKIGDWISPYGNGNRADILFTGHFDKYTNGESDFTLTVTFPNRDDGIQEFIVPDNEKGSALRSAHEAPRDGYQPTWIQTDKRVPGKPIQTNRDPNRNYYFRVRTVVDEKGNIVSANYGKIYGDFMKFTYYLNPTPNDRNVEFDPKRNLIRDLKPLEQVREP